MKRLALVLAGGEGRRMGGAKPLRRLGATTLIAHAVDLARGYADEVAVAVRSPEQVGSTGAQLLTDAADIEGPLGGLVAALRFAREKGYAQVLTLACDMPRLPADLADRLAAALEARPDTRVALAWSGGRLHPVCALWRVQATEEVAAYARAGWRSLKGCADACGGAVVRWEIGDVDPFANANTPEDLEALQPGFAS